MSKDDTETSIDFGIKKVRKHGEYTRVIALDRQALINCGCDPDAEIMAKVELVKRPDQDFLKVTPFCVSPEIKKEGGKEMKEDVESSTNQ